MTVAGVQAGDTTRSLVSVVVKGSAWAAAEVSDFGVDLLAKLLSRKLVKEPGVAIDAGVLHALEQTAQE